MYNYEYLIFWIVVSAIGLVIPYLIEKHKIYWRYYLVPTVINLIGITYLFWSQEQSRNSGASEWGFVVPFGSIFFLVPISFLVYILVIAFINIDAKKQKNT